MPQVEKNNEHEKRIRSEIVVDAYGPEEQAISWYYYLQDKMQFPFTASCISKRRSSPLKVDTTVEVVGMAPEDDCEREMYVEITWEGDTLAVPLIQLEATDADPATQQAIADWHYWIERGYEFG
ncbi:calcium-binding protein [Laspinema olomoucense]|uniref:calcium-binding protein n=1 Tax=Laspinema olomoucense TaxID=3231600 RepID=UPI0021BA7CFE|nr:MULTISPECIES: calcium-binding protein [unclassified Laspinema]MCT7973674.1 calcium-binding protein [Laspinema sp. D3d]MCT7996268.1 calcium-binding protein [Laspinema sp. D3c]